MVTVADLPLVEPWERYADATQAEHFAWWCREHCVQSIDIFDGQPLVLEPWQLRIMGEALAELGEGEAYWRVVALVISKKNGKTSLLAAYALYHLVEDEGAPEVLLAAATDSQAGRLFDTAARFVRSDPWLAARLVVREHEGQIRRVDGFGVLYRVSADSGALSGYNPSLFVADELGDWTTPRRRRAWASMVSGGAMRRFCHVFVISTAGEPADRMGGILGDLMDGNEMAGDLERVHAALTVSRNHPGRTLVYNYCANTLDVSDLDALKLANPASWITRETLAELAASPSLTPGRFLQLHGCVWASSEGAFVTVEAWKALGVPGADLEPGDAITVGFRGGEACALVACRLSDGLLVALAAWPVQSDADAEDVDDVMQHALATYRVKATYCAATPDWQTLVDAWRSALGRQQVVALNVHQAGPRSADATLRFRADVKAGRVRHTADRVLGRQVLSAQMARSRNQPYLVPDARGEAIPAAHAALLAWESRSLLGPGAAAQRSRVPVSW
jgi:hypothetical protein